MGLPRYGSPFHLSHLTIVVSFARGIYPYPQTLISPASSRESRLTKMVDFLDYFPYLTNTSNERFDMNVAMTLTSKVAKEVEGPISASDDSVLEGSLCIKGDLSDLIKIMEAIKKDHLHPKVEIHDVLKDFMVYSFDTLGSRRMYFFDQNGTLRQGRYNYDNTCLDKIACIKKIREILGTGLKESKDFVDGEGRNLSELEVVALRSAGLVVLARP